MEQSESSTDASPSHAAGSERPVQLVATVLCGKAQPLVADAIASVIQWVDHVCLIDTGARDGTVEAARAAAGARHSCWTYRWCDDFAAARNFALHVAERAGATWAMTLDTDERMEWTGFGNREQLNASLNATADVVVWTARERSGGYLKERFVRIPAAVSWTGRVHESIGGLRSGQRRLLDGCMFWEPAKTQDVLHDKLQRDLGILIEETTDQPTNPRWWYYLGQTYEGLKDYSQAIAALDRCVRLDGWAEEGAWACYLASRCLIATGDYRRAEEYCALGMTRNPGAPELPWLAGWCCYQRGAWSSAAAWCRVAWLLAQNSQHREAATFRYLPAWYEGPWDVLRFAYKQLGQTQSAAEAEQQYTAHLNQRRLRGIGLRPVSTQ